MTELTTPRSQTSNLNNSTRSCSRPPVSRFHLEAEKARRNLHEFVRQAWHVLEPDTPFIDGIHVRAICEHLQAITGGRIRNLIINVPPGHAKSLLTAVFWIAWVWISRPQTRWLFASYSATLSVRDSQMPAADRVGLVSAALGQPVSTHRRSEPEATV